MQVPLWLVHLLVTEFSLIGAFQLIAFCGIKLWVQELLECVGTLYLCLLQPTTKLFLNGKFVESKATEWIDVHNPVSAQDGVCYSGASSLFRMLL